MQKRCTEEKDGEDRGRRRSRGEARESGKGGEMICSMSVAGPLQLGLLRSKQMHLDAIHLSLQAPNPRSPLAYHHLAPRARDYCRERC